VKIEARRDALLLIDLQYDFMPGGALAVAGGDEIVPAIGTLAHRFDTVVATQDWHPAGHVSFASTHGKDAFESIVLHGAPQTLWPEHAVRGTRGAALHDSLPTEPITMLLRKGTRADTDSYSAFRENVGPDRRRHSTGLGAWLTSRGITRVFVCGLARDYCVRWTAEDASAEGFETFVLDDLTRGVASSSSADADLAFERARVRLLRTTELA
jgi:nicotinamidase/pyrazinamidase